ncbi:MAG: LPS assembly lipoprotein LptE [Bryobacteraceae bacterium]|jgi:outer membrane lipopolysaccharide assembly protein LptE/RlpB
MNRFAFACLAIAAALAGCGYHVSGQGELMPKNIRTIAVMAMPSTRYQLARLLPADIARELIARTKYKVIDDPNQADAVLSGHVQNFSNFPTLFDQATGRATSVLAVVTVTITLTERTTGKTLFSRPNFEVRQGYQISTNPQQYFDESGTAIQRLSKDVAQSIVSAILENF